MDHISELPEFAVTCQGFVVRQSTHVRPVGRSEHSPEVRGGDPAGVCHAAACGAEDDPCRLHRSDRDGARVLREGAIDFDIFEADGVLPDLHIRQHLAVICLDVDEELSIQDHPVAIRIDVGPRRRDGELDDSWPGVTLSIAGSDGRFTSAGDHHPACNSCQGAAEAASAHHGTTGEEEPLTSTTVRHAPSILRETFT